MLSWLKKKQNSKDHVGISITPSGIACSSLERFADGQSRIKSCNFLPAESYYDAISMLKVHVKDYKLYDKPCQLVLHPQDYHLFVVEKPNVDPAEMVSALRWQIKDLVDTPIDEILIDYFDVAFEGVHPLIYVVAAKQSLVEQYADGMEEIGLDIVGIDITELSLRNLFPLFGLAGEKIAYVSLDRHFSQIITGTDRRFFIGRKLEIDYANLVVNHTDESVAAFGHLATEIQRSIDYFERQYRQVVANQIFFAPFSDNDNQNEWVKEFFGTRLSYPVVISDIRGPLKAPQGINSEVAKICIPSVGAVMREDAS